MMLRTIQLAALAASAAALDTDWHHDIDNWQGYGKRAEAPAYDDCTSTSTWASTVATPPKATRIVVPERPTALPLSDSSAVAEIVSFFSHQLLPTPSQHTAAPPVSTEFVYAAVDKTVTACLPSETGGACPFIPSPGSSGSYGSPPDAGAHQPPPNWPPGCTLPETPLSNEQQVGDSVWGTLCQPYFPQWLPGADGQPYTQAPWGDKNCQHFDGINNADIPVTNVTRYYEFNITRSKISPDGVLRDVMLINNQFPAPAIEANWGDMIEILVHNNIEFPLEGTSLHWHGFLQRGSNWYDGVPSVSQCPIAPGKSFTYRIPAQLYGSSWYHAHYSAQYTAGIVGPIIIHGPTQVPYDIDVGPVMLNDWYHIPYFALVDDTVGTDLTLTPPRSNNLLINGRGRFDCAKPSFDNSSKLVASHIEANLTWNCVDGAELSKFKFQPGKTHRLRLMNIGADGIEKFTIDGHQMTVIAYDFVPSTPHTVDFVTLGVGQRADVLVTANNYTTNMFWMRTSAPGGLACGGSLKDETLAAIYYEGADTNAEPTTLRDSNNTLCENAPLNATQPEYSITPTTQDAFVFDIAITLKLNSTGSYEWRMNDQTFRANFNYPSLMLAAEGNTSFPYDPQWQLINFGSNKSIILNVTNDTPAPHPFHLHGHNFFVLNVGPNQTVWDGSVVNPENPMRRDTQIVPAGGFMALSFENNNPGVWPFHCHIAWHLSGGLAMNFITRPEDIPTIPSGIQGDTCDAWDVYSNTNVVDQIDSGS